MDGRFSEINFEVDYSWSDDSFNEIQLEIEEVKADGTLILKGKTLKRPIEVNKQDERTAKEIKIAENGSSQGNTENCTQIKIDFLEERRSAREFIKNNRNKNTQRKTDAYYHKCQCWVENKNEVSMISIMLVN